MGMVLPHVDLSSEPDRQARIAERIAEEDKRDRECGYRQWIDGDDELNAVTLERAYQAWGNQVQFVSIWELRYIAEQWIHLWALDYPNERDWQGLVFGVDAEVINVDLADYRADPQYDTKTGRLKPEPWEAVLDLIAMAAANTLLQRDLEIRDEVAREMAREAHGTNQTAGPGVPSCPAPGGTAAGLSGGELEKAPILLPSEFFDGCPELEIIRQAAHSRMVSPTALAMVLLARIASMADHRLRLPALVGSHVGLSFYTVLTAKVGGGKSSTTNLAAELLGHDPTSTREVEVITGNGTGEGLIQKHMGKDEENPKGPPIQVLHNVFWYIDEGMNLVKEFERRGSQAAGILCSGWFCAGVGQNNATGELQRSLRPLSYNWGIVIAIQDDNAHHLLDQQGIGLTQRCLWVEGWDPTIPDPDHMPEWPGSLDWRHPPMPGEVPAELRSHLSAPATGDRHVQLPDWYATEHKWALYKQKQTGKVDALGEHIILMEIKLAVLLGMLRGHLDPTDDDIRRARLAIGAHKRQIRRAANRVRLAEAESNLVNAQKAVEKAESRENLLIQRFRDKVVDALSGGDTATWRQLRDKVRGSTRKEMGGEEALADILQSMIDEGIVQCLGGEGMNTIYGAGDALGT